MPSHEREFALETFKRGLTAATSEQRLEYGVRLAEQLLQSEHNANAYRLQARNWFIFSLCWMCATLLSVVAVVLSRLGI